jgi:hypothetical protein
MIYSRGTDGGSCGPPLAQVSVVRKNFVREEAPGKKCPGLDTSQDILAARQLVQDDPVAGVDLLLNVADAAPACCVPYKIFTEQFMGYHTHYERSDNRLALRTKVIDMYKGRCPIGVCSDSWKDHVGYAAALVFSVDGDQNRSLEIIQNIVRRNVTFDQEVSRVISDLKVDINSRKSVVFATVASSFNVQLEN